MALLTTLEPHTCFLRGPFAILLGASKHPQHDFRRPLLKSRTHCLFQRSWETGSNLASVSA
jgi:hypothetical protein